MIDPATALAFSVFENPGVFALVLGSGVSRAAEIPTGWEITLNLTARIGALESAGDQADWAAWHTQRFGEAPNYSKLLDALSSTPDERRAIIHRFIEPTAQDIEEGRKVPTAAHRAIARLVRDGFIRVIITTNFDRLMENALRDEGVEPLVIKSEDDLAGATPLIHTRCLVLKLHGDYLDTRIRNTEDELSAYSPALNSCLDRIFDEHGLVIAGWSADWDTALRSAIVRAPNRRYPLFWTSRGELGDFAKDMVAARSGRVITVDSANTLFERLQRDIETQATLLRPNPLSVELMVASAKRYLAKPEHRIQLSDLVGDAARRTRLLVAEGDFGVNGRPDHEQFRRRVQGYEAIHEGLLRVLYTMGRWGLGEEFALATEVLKGLAQRPGQSGSTFWIAMQSYPGMLALYAYGIGLLRAGRLAELHRWLLTPLRQPYRDENTAAVEKLLLWAFEAHDEESWRSFEGLERHKTALSEHLLTVFREWLQGEFPSRQDLDVAFETFETFGYLAHLGLSANKDALLTAAQSQDRRGAVWAPVGRIGWNGEDQAEVLAAVFGEEQRAKVAAAGFGRGDVEYLPLAETNLKLIFGEFRWMR